MEITAYFVIQLVKHVPMIFSSHVLMRVKLPIVIHLKVVLNV